MYKLLVGTSGSPNSVILVMGTIQKATVLNKFFFYDRAIFVDFVQFAALHTRAQRRSKVKPFLSFKLHCSIAHCNVSRNTLANRKRLRSVYLVLSPHYILHLIP